MDLISKGKLKSGILRLDILPDQFAFVCHSIILNTNGLKTSQVHKFHNLDAENDNV
uniref:Uncharacterized protein n=1 Tax=Anguilla anguilla TaxID=7936 RepID=A0A0E9R9Y0_ANGAN